MTPFQFLQAIFLSFYSKSLYRDVALQWKGRGFLYLAGLMILASASVGYAWHSYLNKIDTKIYSTSLYRLSFGEGNFSETQKLNRLFEVISLLPPLQVQNGELQSEQQGKETIYDPLSPERALVYIDPTIEGAESTTAVPLMIAKDGFFLSLNNKLNFVLYFDDIQLGDHWWNSLFAILENTPKLTLADGIASLDRPSPYQVLNAADKPILHFDTSSTMGHQSFENSDDVYAAFLRQEALFFIDDKNEPLVLDYQQLSKSDIIALFDAAIRRGIHVVNIAGLLVLLPVALLMLLIAMAITSLLAVVGVTFARYRHIFHLTYKDCQRLAAISFTPVLMLKAIAPEFPLNNLVFFFMALGYLCFAIDANKKV